MADPAETKEKTPLPGDEFESDSAAPLPRRAGFAVFRRVFSRFAAAFLILFLLLAAAFAVSPGFREKVAGFVTATFDREASVSLPDSHPSVSNNIRGPTWFPGDTWTRTSCQETQSSFIYQYTSAAGDSITYVELPAAGTSCSIDSEGCEVINDIFVNGLPAVASINDEEKTINIVWIDKEAYVIRNLITTGASSTFSLEDVIRMAESIS